MKDDRVQDFKSRAAKDYETSERCETPSGENALQPHLLEVEAAVVEALFLLQGKMLISLSDDETTLWTQELSKVPVWKLQKADEFVGTKITDIWKFFSELQPPQEAYYAPDEPESEYRSGLSKDFWKHVESLGSFRDFKPKNLHENFPQGYAREREEWLKEKREKEKASLEALHAKYSGIGFDRVIRMRGL